MEKRNGQTQMGRLSKISSICFHNKTVFFFFKMQHLSGLQNLLENFLKYFSNQSIFKVCPRNTDGFSKTLPVVQKGCHSIRLLF